MRFSDSHDGTYKIESGCATGDKGSAVRNNNVEAR